VTLSASSTLRVGLLVLLGVVLQVSGFAQIQVLGATPDLTPLIVAAVALWAGSIPGSITGFCVGLLIDLALGQNVGSSSLVLSAVGYAFAAVSFMLEIEASVSALVLRDAVVTTILNVVIAVPLFGLVRRVIRPVLLAKPVGRRRRAATRETGPLGLRGLEI